MSNNAGRIEITENTLLKLLIRRGSNTERANVVLSEGELGYTVDTRRLFVGDGVTAGGYSTSLFLYFGTGHPSTWASEAEVGDAAYDSIAGGIYRLTVKPYSTSGNWTLFSGPLANRVDDETLQLNATTGVMSVKTVSAAQLDAELAGLGLEFVGTRELQTTANQQFDAIATRNNLFLQLPQSIQFGTAGGATAFNMPAYDGAQGAVFTTDGQGNIVLADPTANTQYMILSSNIVPVGTIVQYGSGGNFNEITSTIPHGYFLCDGTTKDGTVYTALCAAIGQFYGGTSTSFNVPLLTATDFVYLIKYLEDVVYTQSILNINTKTLTAYDVTNNNAVTSLVFPNTGITYEIGNKPCNTLTDANTASFAAFQICSAGEYGTVVVPGSGYRLEAYTETTDAGTTTQWRASTRDFAIATLLTQQSIEFSTTDTFSAFYLNTLEQYPQSFCTLVDTTTGRGVRINNIGTYKVSYNTAISDSSYVASRLLVLRNGVVSTIAYGFGGIANETYNSQATLNGITIVSKLSADEIVDVVAQYAVASKGTVGAVNAWTGLFPATRNQIIIEKL